MICSLEGRWLHYLRQKKILEETQFGETFPVEYVGFEMLIRRVDKTGKALGGHSCG